MDNVIFLFAAWMCGLEKYEAKEEVTIAPRQLLLCSALLASGFPFFTPFPALLPLYWINIAKFFLKNQIFSVLRPPSFSSSFNGFSDFCINSFHASMTYDALDIAKQDQN